ncbi:TPA: hypothetical protein N0F65_002803 [Lagenidium giganteum]|uniref:Mitotic spindle assembly checkpoint protein MAD1 n=1 Tax=Lagenidium giganteum TaxID=4803 RepID=A0AAV2ZG71_9STRA|nr:TPA: hypothetical protein N0F65_002803 [Lagenidium giganteum]
MEQGKRRSDSESFLCSPIPKDPNQVFFVEDNSRTILKQASRIKNSVDSFLDPEAEELARVQMETHKNGRYAPGYVAQLQERVLQLERERKDGKDGVLSDSARQVKRQRMEMESIAVSKSEQLQREVTALQVQMQRNSERHQIEIKERDLQLDKMRRQLRHAVTEEEETRKELKTVKNEYLTEKLKLQKKVVELDSQLQFVEAALLEWKERAIEAESELQFKTRQSKLEVEMLREELEAVQDAADDAAEREDPVLEAKVRLLEAQLQEKDAEVEQARQKLAGAQETLENASSVRMLNEKIAELKSSECKLKNELVDLIETSKNTSILQEKLYQANQKLKQANEQHVAAQKKIEGFLKLEQVHKQFIEYFEPFAKEAESGITMDELNQHPAASIMRLYRARQNAFEMLSEQKSNVEIQLRRLEKQHEKLQSDLITSGNQAAKLEVQLAEMQSKMSGANSVVIHLRKVNEELLAILDTYEKIPEDPTAPDASSRRTELLESSLKKAEELIKKMESSQKEMATPVAIKKYEGRIARLEREAAELKQQNSGLKKHLEKAEMDLAVYEKRLGKGEFNVETTKIVHLAVNPTFELLRNKVDSNQLAQLRKENEILRARIEQLTGSCDVDAPASESKLTTTTSYETVEGQKLLNQRLKEVFRDQIQQYREAVFRLTGYKVDLKKSNGAELLRLRSMYADNDADELLVRMDSSGALELLESDFCAQIDQRVFAYLTTCRSFPAFLGNLTLHLFERQTFQGH